MTRLLLITLLLLSSSPAYAEWVKIGDQDQLGMTVYADRETIRRKGALVKIWQLLDFKIASKDTVRSRGSGLAIQHWQEKRGHSPFLIASSVRAGSRVLAIAGSAV